MPRMIQVYDGDGAPEWLLLDDVLKDYIFTPPDPPGPVYLLNETFSDFWLQDGLLPPIDTGLPSPLNSAWDDCFRFWKIRTLHAAPNNDQGYKKAFSPITHEIKDGNLFLRALPAPRAPATPGGIVSPTGYLGGMISSEARFAYQYGRLDIRMRVNRFGPGLHFSLWTKPKNLAGARQSVEYDLLELIGSNRHRPDGPVNSLFMNAKNSVLGYWKERPVAPGFINAWHEYSLIWRESGLEWRIDDEPVHNAPNLLDEPACIYVTHEVGASSNGDFPGPIKPATFADGPAEVEIDYIRVRSL